MSIATANNSYVEVSKCKNYCIIANICHNDYHLGAGLMDDHYQQGAAK